MKIFFSSKGLFKKILIIGMFCYLAVVFVNQQKTLNAYNNEQKYYKEQIAQQKDYKTELTTVKENVNSPEYIEQIAREKLDMYLSNERVYVDINK